MIPRNNPLDIGVRRQIVIAFLSKKPFMQLRLKLLLLSTIPILVALGSVAVTVRHQTLKLAHQERELVESAYLHSKETELHHYVQLAQSAMARIAADVADPAARHQQALALLSRMQFGKDGYFFVYDRQGNVLLDAQQMGLAGVDLCDPSNPQSEAPANLILAKAREGGGLVRYLWQKPSSQQTVPKLAYVMTLPGWEWVIGTGLYLDDVHDTLRRIDLRAQENIDGTRRRIYGIAALCIVLIGLAGLALNLSDHRVASAKLRRLAQRWCARRRKSACAWRASCTTAWCRCWCPQVPAGNRPGAVGRARGARPAPRAGPGPGPAQPCAAGDPPRLARPAARAAGRPGPGAGPGPHGPAGAGAHRARRGVRAARHGAPAAHQPWHRAVPRGAGGADQRPDARPRDAGGAAAALRPPAREPVGDRRRPRLRRAARAGRRTGRHRPAQHARAHRRPGRHVRRGFQPPRHARAGRAALQGDTDAPCPGFEPSQVPA